MDEKPANRRRFQFSIVLMLLLMALFAELFAVWTLTPKQPVYTPQNWSQLEKGMSKVDVERIMGSRGRNHKSWKSDYWLYDGSDKTEWSTLKVEFKNNYVIEVRHW